MEEGPSVVTATFAEMLNLCRNAPGTAQLLQAVAGLFRQTLPELAFHSCKQLFITPFIRLTLVSWIFLCPYHLFRISPVVDLNLFPLFVEFLKPPLPGNLP